MADTAEIIQSSVSCKAQRKREIHEIILDILSTLDLHIGGKSSSFQRCPKHHKVSNKHVTCVAIFSTAVMRQYILEVMKPEKFWRLKPVSWRLRNLTQTALFSNLNLTLGPLQLQILHWRGRHRACEKATVDGQQHPLTAIVKFRFHGIQCCDEPNLCRS